MFLAYSEYASPSGFLHTASCLFKVSSVAVQPTVCTAGIEMHAKKRKAQNTASFKHYARLGQQQVIGSAQILQRRPFQEGG